MVGSVSANDVSVEYKDSLTTGETNATRADVFYTSVIDTREFKRIWLTLQIQGIRKDDNGENSVATDTVFANDSFFVFYQYSSDKINWFTSTNDTLQKIKKGANDTILNIATDLSRDSLHLGNYARIKFLHRNKLITETGLPGNSYTKRLTVWFNTVK